MKKSKGYVICTASIIGCIVANSAVSFLAQTWNIVLFDALAKLLNGIYGFVDSLWLIASILLLLLLLNVRRQPDVLDGMR